MFYAREVLPVNRWSRDQIRQIEEDAAKIDNLRDRASFLHNKTSLAWHVCLKWADIIKVKFKLLNGDPGEKIIR